MFGFDIFCRVIDYFGDAGVCWRLAQSLADPSYGHSVRLWVDNLHTLARIEPKINPRKKHQVHNHVDIKFWPTKGDNTIHFSWPNPYQVAIETFSCGLPNAFAVQMKGAHIHINLDHLSAEKWVEYAHRSEEHTSELQSRGHLVCRLLLEKK